MADNTHRFSWALVGLTLLCLLSFFWNLGGYGLFDLDEALYANCAREMQLSGNYVIPTVNGVPFFEKPPLVYWLAAGFYEVFGRNELTTRLPSAILSLALTISIYLLGKRVFGRKTGLLASAFFCTAPLVFGSARQLTTDATLDFCIFGTITSWFISRELSPNRVWWYFLGCIFCAFGVLAKGLPGILIPAVVLGLYFWAERRHSGKRVSIRPTAEQKVGVSVIAFGMVLFICVSLPWHLLALKHGGKPFYDEYIFRQHIGRFRGGDINHLAPFWFFIPGFLVGAFPWSFFVPAALLEKLTVETSDEPVRLRLLLKIWFAIVFLMFSASGSKLISYILPLYPAAALLAADWSVRTMNRKDGAKAFLRTMILPALLSITLLIVVIGRNVILSRIHQANGKPISLDMVPEGSFEWAAHLFLAITVATVAFCFLAYKRQSERAFAALIAGMACFLGFAVFEGLPLIDRSLLRPIQTLARQGGESSIRQSGNVVLKTGSSRRPSVIFYLPDAMVNEPFGRITHNSEVTSVQDLVVGIHGPFTSILIDEKSIAQLPKNLNLQELSRSNGWALLQTMQH